MGKRKRRLKQAAVFLLTALFILTMPLAVRADGKNLMDNYVLSTIFGQRQATRTISADGQIGYGNMYDRNLSIDLSEQKMENLAVSMKVYVEQVEGERDPLEIFTAKNGVGLLELANESNGSNNSSISWSVRDLKCADGSELKAGEWNDVLLLFSSGTKKQNFTLEKSVTWFNFYVGHLPSDIGIQLVRLKDVCVVDTSKKAQTDNTADKDWDTSYEVTSIPLTMDQTQQKKGGYVGSYITLNPTIDVSAHNPEKLQLQMDIEVENKTNPGDVSVLKNVLSGQVELTSGGTCDKNEIAWNVKDLPWKSGKATYQMNFATAVKSGGDIEYSKLNYIRIFFAHWPTDEVVNIKVSNVRIVDITNVCTTPTIFDNGMVFQQNKPLQIWGNAQSGKNITVKLLKGGKTAAEKTVKVGTDGKWLASLDAQKGSYDTYMLEVLENGKSVKRFEDILIGEVWLAGGQSNMALNVGTAIDSEELLANATDEYLRFYLEPSYPNGQTGEQPITPMDDVTSAYWGKGTNKNVVNSMSAVAYSFAKKLQKELNVPVAVLNTPTGGTVIEAWTPKEAIDGDSNLVYELKKRGLYYSDDFWSDAAGTMSTLYNQKIGPITNFNIAGAIWYQGESNSNRAELYDTELSLMKKSWSDAFGFENNSMPFIFTQVAAGQYDNGGTNMQHLCYLSEAMTRAFRQNEDKNMAMLTIYDQPLVHVKNGTSSNPIHPRTKTPVGERFADAAMNMVYGGTGVYTAPVYKSMEISGNSIYITFDYVGDGLRLANGETTLHGFAIAGKDGVYVDAKAEIVGKNQIKIYNTRVKNPKNVTYAFSNLNQASNLVNSAGIPAAPFRTQQVTDTDTTYKPTDQMTFFTAIDWIYADQDVWVYDKNVSDIENFRLGFRPSWETKNGTYSYSEDVKAEGKASLKLDFTKAGTVSVGPVLGYGSQKINYGNFKYLSVCVNNADGKADSIGLSIVSGGKTYTVMPENSKTDKVSLSAENKFTTVIFDMYSLKDGNTDAAELWKNAEKIQFHFETIGAGSVYVDDISFGMTKRAAEESDIPVASYDVSGQKIAADNITCGERAINIVEKEGRNSICIENNGYVHFSVDNDKISKEDHDLMLRITFYDNISAAFGLQYNCITDKEANEETSDTKFKTASINRYATGKWSTVTVCINDASFRHAQFGKYDFRFYGKGEEGTYISKIEVIRKTADPDEEEIGARFGASEQTEFTGKSFTGYQAWFSTGSQTDSWGHYSYGSKEADGTAWPRKDHVTIDYFPYVKDYDESALAQTGFDELGSGEPTKLYNSSNEQVISTHFKWMHDYGIDGAALQRFAGVIRGRAVYNTPEATQLYKIKKAAEENSSLFYIMYDISGGTQITDSSDTISISSYVDDIKFDWVYNIENALQMTNSSAYTTVSGKPVVCLWGTTVSGRPDRIADYQELIDFFHKRNCYVIFGVSRDWCTNTTTLAKYEEVLKQVDMISPWMVGSNVSSTEAIDSLYKNYTQKDWTWCQANDVDYYPVVFSGFSWALWHENDAKPNQMPRNAGQNLWYQAYKIKELGIPSFYIAMFDEYDEGTAIAKNASDYFDIPKDQWFVTASCDGYWLSQDFQLRVAGEANRMVKGLREAVKENPVEHSLGPIYYRNSFESKYVNCPTVKYRGDYPVDPCFKNEEELISEGVTATVSIEKNTLAKTGDYMAVIEGKANADDVKYLYRFSETKILLKENMKLNWSVYAANEDGKQTSLVLLLENGKTIEVKPQIELEKKAWTECSTFVGTKENAGERIVGIALSYTGTEGKFKACYDDIILEDGMPSDVSPDIPVTENADWTELNAYLDTISKFVASNYTEESWNVLKAVVEKAEALQKDSTQEVIDEVTEQIRQAIDGLQLKENSSSQAGMDWSKLAIYKEVAAKFAEEDYTAESYVALTEALKKANALPAESSQEQIDAAAEQIKQAISGLIRRTESEISQRKQIKLSDEKKTLGVKEKYKLKVTRIGTAGSLSFESSNKKVAVVSKNGTITAKKKGSAVITVRTADGLSAGCKITVKKAPTSVKFTAKSKTLKKGKTWKLKVKLSKGSAGTLTYTSSNKKVVSVDETGKMQALKKGKAVITVQTYNKKKDKIVITVR